MFYPFLPNVSTNLSIVYFETFLSFILKATESFWSYKHDVHIDGNTAFWVIVFFSDTDVESEVRRL